MSTLSMCSFSSRKIFDFLLSSSSSSIDLKTFTISFCFGTLPPLVLFMLTTGKLDILTSVFLIWLDYCLNYWLILPITFYITVHDYCHLMFSCHRHTSTTTITLYHYLGANTFWFCIIFQFSHLCLRCFIGDLFLVSSVKLFHLHIIDLITIILSYFGVVDLITIRLLQFSVINLVTIRLFHLSFVSLVSTIRLAYLGIVSLIIIFAYCSSDVTASFVFFWHHAIFSY